MARKRLRKKFGKSEDLIDIRSLLQSQKDSYNDFLHGLDGKESGIQKAMESVFPIKGRNNRASIEFLSCHLGPPHYNERESRMHGANYAVPLYATLCLIVRDRADKYKSIKKRIEQKEVYIGDINLMTPEGSFIVNGTERVVVSQLHRSPGVFFSQEKTSAYISGKSYSARIIPYHGSWLDFEFDSRDRLFARIDRRYRVPINVLLTALGMSVDQILEEFYDKDTVRLLGDKWMLRVIPEHLRGETAMQSIETGAGKVLIAKDQRITPEHIRLLEEAGVEEIEVPDEYLIGKPLSGDFSLRDATFTSNMHITKEMLDKFREESVAEFHTIYTNELTKGAFIADTVRDYPVPDKNEAVLELYRIMRPGEMENLDVAVQFFNNLFFSDDRYSLSHVGRMKLNKRLGRDSKDGEDVMVLQRKDIIDTVKILLDIRKGVSEVDDIDSLSNRRVRQVGEMMFNQLRLGLLRIERAVRERLSLPDIDTYTPKDLVSAKAVSGAIRDFFTSSQLSQLTDQINPLAEITHKRRISALGPGGLSRDRAGFEVRDVHPTHYGRLCPIETPEGANIGLINSMAIHTKINEFGFLETPYRKVSNGKATDAVVWLSAMDEKEHTIASGNNLLDSQNKFVEKMLMVRHKGDVIFMPREEITLMDVDAKQLISVAASLIPFLEHDDANRALMGSNMQRQAVPLLKKQKPLVGTGMESYVARDAGSCILARRKGIVEEIDAKRIVVRVTEDDDELPVDIYSLARFRRSNQNTVISQRPVVKLGDKVEPMDVLADGAATDMGELALGTNLRVGFMCWKGYNFEDSILISERLVADDVLTSIHIMEFVCTVRNTKLGDEEITREIPNIGEAALANLDTSGIIRVGAQVKSGDILVGMITPKSEDTLTAEESLLRAVFGEKAADVKDSSLRLPSGVKGKVIDVEVFTKGKENKDSRAKEIDKEQLAEIRKESKIRYQMVRKITETNLKEKLKGKAAAKGKGLKAGQNITAAYLAKCELEDIFGLSMRSAALNDLLEKARENLEEVEVNLNKQLKKQEKGIRSGAEGLAPGVLKIVKVYVAAKRPIQSGDKLAGRHGNKGVVSAVMPTEDMPHDEEGNALDIVLSPLGLPSRMNIGQLLEAHLGDAAKELGRKITALMSNEKKLTALRKLLDKVYASMDNGRAKKFFGDLTDEQLLEVCQNYKDGVPFATPVFYGAKEEDIKEMLNIAGASPSERKVLFDGRTGEQFDRPVTVGQVYMLKLNHLVEDKIHARSIGSYGLVTRQPLGGKAQMGGQRFGEMEVWALESYGAAYTLQEMLTVKSDDERGRNEVYKNIIAGSSYSVHYIPESFHVLINEIRSLGLNIDYKN